MDIQRAVMGVRPAQTCFRAGCESSAHAAIFFDISKNIQRTALDVFGIKEEIKDVVLSLSAGPISRQTVHR